jgi:hypothetical protein
MGIENNRCVVRDAAVVSAADNHAFRINRSELSRSVDQSLGFAVCGTIVDQINWREPSPWFLMLCSLNEAPRSVVSVAQCMNTRRPTALERP